jgi:hypothetical protein
MSHRIQFVLEKVKELKHEYGELGYAEKHKQLKEALSNTFTIEQKKEAKELFEVVLSQQHIPSAKELISGIDISLMMRGVSSSLAKKLKSQGNQYQQCWSFVN